MRIRWYVVLAALALVAVAIVTVRSIVDPSDSSPPPPPPSVGPSMPSGYTVDWVPMGDRVYPCIRQTYKDSISCDFTRPSPTPGSTPS